MGDNGMKHEDKMVGLTGDSEGRMVLLSTVEIFRNRS